MRGAIDKTLLNMMHVMLKNILVILPSTQIGSIGVIFEALLFLFNYYRIRMIARELSGSIRLAHVVWLCWFWESVPMTNVCGND